MPGSGIDTSSAPLSSFARNSLISEKTPSWRRVIPSTCPHTPFSQVVLHRPDRFLAGRMGAKEVDQLLDDANLALHGAAHDRHGDSVIRGDQAIRLAKRKRPSARLLLTSG